MYVSPSDKIYINDIKKLLNSNGKTMVIGDYNARHSHWHCARSNVLGNAVYKLINQNNYNLYFPCDNPTHIPNNGTQPSTIDVAITNQPNVSKISAINDLNSDHLPISITVNVKTNREPENIFLKRTIDWLKFRKRINDCLVINNTLHNIAELNAEIDIFTAHIQKALEISTTTIIITPSKPPTTPEIKSLIKNRNSLRKRYQTTRQKSILKDIKTINREINDKFNSLKSDILVNKIKKLSFKDNSLWNFTKRLTSQNNFNINKLHSPNGIIYDEQSKADTIGEHYYQSHKSTEHMSDRTTSANVNKACRLMGSAPDEFPDTMLSSPGEIKSIIHRLNAMKAPGHDGITNAALKNLPRRAIIQLMYLLNACLKLKFFPDSWKRAIVLPFLKPGKDKLFAANYRPISLLPTLGKVLEKIILGRLKKKNRERKDYNTRTIRFQKQTQHGNATRPNNKHCHRKLQHK